MWTCLKLAVLVLLLLNPYLNLSALVNFVFFQFANPYCFNILTFV